VVGLFEEMSRGSRNGAAESPSPLRRAKWARRPQGVWSPGYMGAVAPGSMPFGIDNQVLDAEGRGECSRVRPTRLLQLPNLVDWAVQCRTRTLCRHYICGRAGNE
jgi:hypothetical protein